jgi:hypothetical protein
MPNPTKQNTSALAVLVTLGLIVTSCLYLGNFFSSSPSSTTSSSNSTPPAPAPPATQSLAPAEFTVKSEIVKRIGNRYRYFFDIRNHSKYSLKAGAVHVTLLDDKGTEIERGHVSFPYSLDATDTDIGFVRYLDSDSGPAGKGDGRVKTFRYEVLLREPSFTTPGGANGALVSDQSEPFRITGLTTVTNGTGQITAQFEDMSDHTAESYTNDTPLKTDAELAKLTSDLKSLLGDDRLERRDVQYNPHTPKGHALVSVEFTVQKKGEPMPSRDAVLARSAAILKVFHASNLPWDQASISADGPTDQMMFIGLWDRKALAGVDWQTDPNKLLTLTAIKPFIDRAWQPNQ